MTSYHEPTPPRFDAPQIQAEPVISQTIQTLFASTLPTLPVATYVFKANPTPNSEGVYTSGFLAQVEDLTSYPQLPLLSTHPHTPTTTATLLGYLHSQLRSQTHFAISVVQDMGQGVEQERYFNAFHPTHSKCFYYCFDCINPEHWPDGLVPGILVLVTPSALEGLFDDLPNWPVLFGTPTVVFIDRLTVYARRTLHFLRQMVQALRTQPSPSQIVLTTPGMSNADSARLATCFFGYEQAYVLLKL